MPDGFESQVMLCWPSNRDEIKLLSAYTDQEPFVPTIEHSLSNCDSCDRSVWIGPQQLQLVQSAFVKTRKLCMFCISEVQRTLKLKPQGFDVGLSLREARRRTS